MTDPLQTLNWQQSRKITANGNADVCNALQVFENAQHFV